jgi:hypothetical protein
VLNLNVDYVIAVLKSTTGDDKSLEEWRVETLDTLEVALLGGVLKRGTLVSLDTPSDEASFRRLLEIAA